MSFSIALYLGLRYNDSTLDRTGKHKKGFDKMFTGILRKTKLFVLCGLLCVSICLTACDSSDYKKAMQLYNSGNYNEAIVAFKTLGNYKDCQDMISLCEQGIKLEQLENDYQAAIQLYEEKEYTKAQKAFQLLAGYQESDNYVSLCINALNEETYQEGITLFENGDYQKAYDEFKKVDDYSDSQKYIDIIQKEHQAYLISVGSSFKFGHYEQDGNISNGSEEINWCVVSVNQEENKIQLVSEKILEYMPYVKTYYFGSTVTWEKSEIRRWLNNDFYNFAFTEEEQSKILLTDVENDGNSTYFNVPSGNNTKDKVYLPSIEEVLASENLYKKLQGGTKAAAQGLVQSAHDLGVNISEKDAPNLSWTRTPGRETFAALVYRIVQSASKMVIYDYDGVLVTLVDNGVRPAIWVNLGESQ